MKLSDATEKLPHKHEAPRSSRTKQLTIPPWLYAAACLTVLVNVVVTAGVLHLSKSSSESPFLRTVRWLAGKRAQATTNEEDPQEGLPLVGPWGPLGLRGLSHFSVNVPDVDEAAEFYHRVLGYEIMSGGELWGDFDFRGLEMKEFCLSAGFMDGKCKLDCLWLRHPHMHINLELFHYYSPNVRNRLEEKGWLSNTQDIGGLKHICYEVANADKAFNYLKEQPGVTMISEHPDYRPTVMSPLPLKFFYWRDPYGVQWECEEGDEVVTRQVAGVTRLMDRFIEYKK